MDLEGRFRDVPEDVAFSTFAEFKVVLLEEPAEAASEGGGLRYLISQDPRFANVFFAIDSFSFADDQLLSSSTICSACDWFEIDRIDWYIRAKRRMES